MKREKGQTCREARDVWIGFGLGDGVPPPPSSFLSPNPTLTPELAMSLDLHPKTLAEEP